jgi:hypothetical protein
MSTTPSVLRKAIVPLTLVVAAAAPAVAAAKTRPVETHPSTSALELKLQTTGTNAARGLNPGTTSAPLSRSATFSRRQNRRVTVQRAQNNARAFAEDVFLADGPAFDYGTARNSDCRRRSRANVACWGWVDTYSDSDYALEYPMTCWFKVRTTGTPRSFRVTYDRNSVYCEDQV